MRNSPYLSTSQTAQMLGLSVGTIQRMVESGALQAYTTQGGHRRILASAVRHYCHQQGLGKGPALATSPQVCIIHSGHMSPELQRSLRALPEVQLVSHPLELAGLGDHHPLFFVDAQLRWIDWSDLHRPASQVAATRWIVYNSAGLSAEQQKGLAAHVQLYPEELSLALVQGVLLALSDRHELDTTPPAHH